MNSNNTFGHDTVFRKIVYILVPFLVFFVVHDIAQTTLSIIGDTILIKGGQEASRFITDNVSSLRGLINAVSMGIGILALIPCFKKDREIKPWAEKADGKENRKREIPDYVVLGVFSACAALFLNMLMILTGFTGMSETYNEIAARQYDVDFIFGIFIYGLISPYAEEAVFRKLMYGRMRRYYTKIPCMIVSSLIFGIYHMNLVQGIYGMLMGFLFVFMYEEFENFMAPFLMHAVSNAGIYILSYETTAYQGLVTVLNCVIFGLISILALIILIYRRNGKNIFLKKSQ